MVSPVVIAAGISAVGSLIQAEGIRESGRASRIAGERARVAAEFESRQAEVEGGLSVAIAQREAFEERRLADLSASRALAVAAASGGGASDPTIVRILSNIRGEGAFRASVAFYEGEAKARKLRLQAITGRITGSDAAIEGINRQRAANLQATGKLFDAGATLFSRFGSGGPNAGEARGDAALVDFT